MKKKSKSAKKEQRRAMVALKEENRILRSEIKRLNRTFRTYYTDLSKHSKKEIGAEKLFSHEQKSSLALTSSSYVKYLSLRLTHASFYGLIKKISGGFRKFKLISTVMRVLSSVITFIGTGAFFIFVSGVAIFFFPFVLLLCAAVYLASMLFRKKAFKRLEEHLNEKDIFVFFPTSGRPFEKGSCFEKTLHKVSKDTKDPSFVIVVSPFFIASHGFGGKGYYAALRFENENTCLIRKHVFFALRRKLLGKCARRTTYVY